MSDGIKVHFSDEAQLLGYGESDSTGAWIKFRVTDEDLGVFRGLKGQVFAMSLVKLDDMTGRLETVNQILDKPEEKKPKKRKAAKKKGEYGQYIAKLHTGGFFMNPKVQHALGGDNSFQAWTRLQPCTCCGDLDYVELTAGSGLVPRCEYAHVNRADNSGKGMKATMSGIPFCHKHHLSQHNSGFSVVWLEHLDRKKAKLEDDVIQDAITVERGADSWAEQTVNENLVKWGHAKLSLICKVESLTEADPAAIYNWAFKNALTSYLPAMFKKSDITSRASMLSEGGAKL